MKLNKTILTIAIITSMMLLSISSKESLVQLTYGADYEDDWHHPLIYSEDAWEITQGRKDIVVAVIDSGVDFSHPDIINTRWINTEEIADNLIDDDGNGYVDDVYGWDFVSNDSVPGPEVVVIVLAPAIAQPATSDITPNSFSPLKYTPT